MEICELKKEDEKAWDEYVLKNPKSTFYHQIGWKKIIEKSYGHKSYYLFMKDNGIIIGIFPLTLMNNKFLGKRLISLPFAPYGGAIGDEYFIEEKLIDYGTKIIKEISGDYIEIRNNIEVDSKLITNANYLTFFLRLENNPELLWNNFSNKIRNAVRNAKKSKLEICDGNIEEFYKLYSINMAYLGTPVHSKNFFNLLKSEFNDAIDILTVKYMEKPVSSAIFLYYKDTVISGWAASDRQLLISSPNNLLYWSAIKKACEKDYKFFDFGRSIKSSGTYRFKKSWGAKEKQLFYTYFLNKECHVPDTNQNNKKRKLFARFWKKLPFEITKWIGPILRKNLP